MEVALTHSLTYSLKGDVPVSIVAQNIIANERLIQESIRILGACFGSLEIQKVSVRVDYISNTSPLREAFAIAVFLTYQDQLTEEVPALIQALTGQSVHGYETLVTVLVLMAGIYVIDATIQRVFSGKDAKELKKEYKSKLKALSDMAHLEPEVIEAAVKNRLSEGKQRSLFKRAYEFFLPAKLEPGSQILMMDNVGVSDAAISEIPSDIDWAQLDTFNVYEIHNAKIEIHRADVDYSHLGWVAVIDEVSNRRRKMVLPPDIQPADLYGKKVIVGDVSVVEEIQESGEYVTKEYRLINLKK